MIAQSERLGLWERMCRALSAKGKHATILGDPKQAIKLGKESRTIADAIQDPRSSAVAQGVIAKGSIMETRMQVERGDSETARLKAARALIEVEANVIPRNPQAERILAAKPLAQGRIPCFSGTLPPTDRIRIRP
ncbi:MAG: hypothetical protein HW380_454 [Magnetococcales bacterium]|nr:hypothetical protein [Magnetococcales bacterium]